MADKQKEQQPVEKPPKPHKSLGEKIKDALKEVADDAGNALGEAFENR